MDNIQGDLKTIRIGVDVAIFLLNTCHALQAIELNKECLSLLNNVPQGKEHQSTKSFYHDIYSTMFRAYYVTSHYTNAAKYARELRVICHDAGDTDKEEELTLALAEIYQKLYRFAEAKELYESLIDRMKAKSDREGEASCYANLGTVFSSLSEYQRAEDCLERALAIRIKIGDRKGEAEIYENRGSILHLLGDYEGAKIYLKKALAIAKDTDDRRVEAEAYGNLGTLFVSLGQYSMAMENIDNALAVRAKIGDRKGEAADYENRGAVYSSIGDLPKAKECHEKALAIRVEIGDRKGEATSYKHLGTVFRLQGEYDEAEECLKRALKLSIDIRDKITEIQCLCGLSELKSSQVLLNTQKASSYLFESIKKLENVRRFQKDSDHFKISLLETHGTAPYKLLRRMFLESGKPQDVLYVEELRRGRALADLVTTQYSIEQHISVNQQSWSGIENVMRKERNCTCLYTAYSDREVFLWVLKTSGRIYFEKVKVTEDILQRQLAVDLDGIFSKCSIKNPNFDTIPLSTHETDLASLTGQGLSLFLYKIIIAPVADLLTEPEIIIVPDRSLYQVPFVALCDEDGKSLLDSYRIRAVPSLNILKLVQDSPADYHSQTGALIVGDPRVGRVLRKGKSTKLSPLPCAGKEAQIIGRLLGVWPLLGEQATKQAVLQQINSVSLIHFATHGCAERGEIFLSPNYTADRIPKEDDYLLTMSDISKVQLRAKLVVLSCCHSGRGQIKNEGVIGIARAFLGSGARSVLVTICSIEDAATEQLMTRFYEHLARGDSASESLQEAMKWVKSNGFNRVSQWASFQLIGDNVTFDCFNKGTT